MSNKKQLYYYKYEIKENPKTNKCKIMRFKLNGTTNAVMSYGCVYKNLDRTTAEDHKYFLDRGKQPI